MNEELNLLRKEFNEVQNRITEEISTDRGYQEMLALKKEVLTQDR